MKTLSAEKDRQKPDKAFGIALLGLDSMGPARFRRLKSLGNFSTVWNFVCSKPAKEIARLTEVRTDIASKWKLQAQNICPEEIYDLHSDLEVAVLEEQSYPEPLKNDLEPPDILFAKGSYTLREVFNGRPVVGIVGTRNCSRYGADIAFELGRELSAAGAVVVSGLAKGIDVSAHFGSTGALKRNSDAAPSAAVIGCGLDIVYPRQSKKFYELVCEFGIIISESPLGTSPSRWRFPARNRIIAGLSDLLIIVESHLTGGALITAEEAGIRGKLVMAVPGSIRSPSSLGTNHLISEGCQILTGIDDVFTALDLMNKNTNKNLIQDPASQQTKQEKSAKQEKGDKQEQAASKEEELVLDAFCWEAVDFETLLKRCGLDIMQLSHILETLIQKERVSRKGLKFERISEIQ